MEAESSFDESYRNEKAKAEIGKKAADDARVNGEHAEITRRHVRVKAYVADEMMFVKDPRSKS
jgi:hypothetical protein